MSDILANPKHTLDACIEDLKTAKVEIEFSMREMLIRLRHAYGAIIREYYPDSGITKVIGKLSEAIDVSERSLWYCVSFADMFPSVEDFLSTQEKNISWRKVITKYLTTGKEEAPKEPDQTGVKGLTPDSPIALPKDGKQGALAKLWIAYISQHPCVFHPDRPSEPHHFPTTKGAGALPHEAIPVCGECHRLMHDNLFVFWAGEFYEGRKKVFKLFYDFINSVEVKSD